MSQALTHPRAKEYTFGLVISILFAIANYFRLGPFNFSNVEVAGFITGAWSVWLVARNSMLTWPVGIINGALFVWLFADAKLFADATINMWYVVAGFYGWIFWLRGGANHTRARITHMKLWEGVLITALIAVSITFMAHHLLALHDPNPWIDALTALGSMAAFWLQSRKRIESWYIWIAVDVLYIPLYFIRHLPLTGVLYIIFMTMCFVGIANWRKLYQAQETDQQIFQEGSTPLVAGALEGMANV